LFAGCGPQPDGQIQSEFVERLEAVGDWTHRNAAAIYGCTYGPIQGETSFRTTERGNSIYVFAMDSLAEDIRVEGLQKTVSKVQMVATGKPVAFTAAAGGIRIPDTKGLWSNGIPVIELRC
jgi:alpha-L-fucosidase